jgi:septal ring factor EnvC (AmiA/AmiB activator)
MRMTSRRTSAVLVLLLVFAVCLRIEPVRAQGTGPASTIAPLPPIPAFDPTAVLAAVGASSAWTQAAAQGITTLGQNQAADEAALKSIADQSAAVAALQTKLAADEATIASQQAAIAALSARVAALEGKVTTAGTTLAKP